jgi:hypothetical protein
MSVARVAVDQDEVAPVARVVAMVGGIVKVLPLVVVMLVVGTAIVVAMVVAGEIAIPTEIEAKETEVVVTGSVVAVSANDALWVPVVPVPARVPIPSVVMEVSALAHRSAVGNRTVGA